MILFSFNYLLDNFHIQYLKMNFPKSPKGFIYSHNLLRVAWTSMFCNTCSHFSTGIAHFHISNKLAK